jgi:uncharacterized protein
MTLHISAEQARRFLVAYHFAPTDIAGVFARLGTVQYDPINPVGRNPDLVLQARISGYRVDDWQAMAYQERLIYDGWDKQACLIPVSDWPLRAAVRAMYRPYHDREIMETAPDAALKILAAIDAQGPLSSLEFEDRERYGKEGSWYGQTRTKRILRAMWACGELVTHHRKSGRHYYDRPERVIPAQHYTVPLLEDEEAYHRWIIARRFQAVGLLRPQADGAIWTICGKALVRKLAITQLVEGGALTPVKVGERQWLYYMPTNLVPLLDTTPTTPRVIFLAPLDSFMWDRKAVLQLFNFDYAWEIYKPAPQRRWGYYVLPIIYGDRFIGRLDSRLENGTWKIARWWWEAEVEPDAEMLDALRLAAGEFLRYLQADDICVDESVEAAARTALLGASA